MTARSPYTTPDKLVGIGQEEGVAASPPEGWRPIAGYGGDYEVSSLGRVRSFKSGLPLLMSPIPDTDGYLTIKLHLSGVPKRHKISRLVCAAFNGEAPGDRYEAAHLDGDKRRNVPDNLEWATGKQNNAHKALHGTRQTGERNGRAKFAETTVAKVHALSRGGYSEVRIAEATGVSKSHVHRILAGEARHD